MNLLAATVTRGSRKLFYGDRSLFLNIPSDCIYSSKIAENARNFFRLNSVAYYLGDSYD